MLLEYCHCENEPTTGDAQDIQPTACNISKNTLAGFNTCSSQKKQ